MGNQLTPLASLCLGVVRGWINVAKRGKGGQIDEEGTAWTRLPADQLRDQLEREYMVEVSTRSIHRALKELTEANQLRRNQRWKHRYKRDYWYAIPEYEEQLDAHRPRSIASNYGWSETNPIASAPKAPALRPPQSTERVEVEPTMPIMSERSGSIEQNEVTGVSDQVLSTPNLNTPISRGNSQKPKPKTTRKDTISVAVETCYAKGKSNGGKGFGENTTRKRPISKGMDELGRVLSEIWVGGRSVMVVDDPKTIPIG